MRHLRFYAHCAAAVVLTAAAFGIAVGTAAASAPVCGADQVTVVTDFHELGGGVQNACVNGGGNAAKLFASAGFALTFVQRTPGFVCRVSGLPADDPCVNTPPEDAYWGVWWSSPTGGQWVYSTLGIGSLDVPAGGYVALSWNGSKARSAPGLAPQPHPSPTPTPKPTPAPTPTPTAKPSGSASPHPTLAPTPSPSITAVASPTASPTPDWTLTPTKSPRPTVQASVRASVTPTRKPKPTKSVEPSVSASPPASASPTPNAKPTGDAAESEAGSVPVVPLIAIAALFVAAGGIAVARRGRRADQR